jgi:hypothetical protein
MAVRGVRLEVVMRGAVIGSLLDYCSSWSYFLIARADGNGEIAESIETNNALARAIQVIQDQ